MFAFRVADDVTNFSVYDVSRALRERGWLVPAYPLPPALDDVHVLRVVVRNGFSADLGDQLVTDLHHAVEELDRQPAPLSRPDAAFHH